VIAADTSTQSMTMCTSGEFGARLLAAADGERRRIERELHDGPQQRLVSLSLRLRLIAARVTPGSEVERLLADAREELAASLQELRGTARGLHPAIVSNFGLAAALESLTARAQLRVELVVDLDRRPPEAVEVAAYYLVSEALTNVVKHARAATAYVSVVRRGDQLVVDVIDDGDGGADPAGGSGFRGLADRLVALGGHLGITSLRAGETTLRAEIPFDRLHSTSEAATTQPPSDTAPPANYRFAWMRAPRYLSPKQSQRTTSERLRSGALDACLDEDEDPSGPRLGSAALRLYATVRRADNER